MPHRRWVWREIAQYVEGPRFHHKTTDGHHHDVAGDHGDGGDDVGNYGFGDGDNNL